MTERRFLNLVITEGIILVLIGVTMLLLPKITTITFGIMICLAFIIYGGYKAINAFLSRNYTRHYILNMVLGILLFIIGATLFFAPTVNLLIITALIGIYFLAESITSAAFAIQIKNILYFWWTYIILAVFEFLIGLIIIIGLPATSLLVIGILTGISFLIAGILLINMFIATNYLKN